MLYHVPIKLLDFVETEESWRLPACGAAVARRRAVLIKELLNIMLGEFMVDKSDGVVVCFGGLPMLIFESWYGCSVCLSL